MGRAGWIRHLAKARSLLEAAEARVPAAVRDVDPDLVRPLRARLRNARSLVIAASVGRPPSWRFGLTPLLIAAVSWPVAMLGGPLIGLSGGWTIALTVLSVVFGLSYLMYRLDGPFTEAVGLRRTAGGVAPAVPPGISPGAEVLALVRMARAELAAAMDARAASHRHADLAATAPGFDWIRERDRPLARASHADRELCVVIGVIEDVLRPKEIE